MIDHKEVRRADTFENDQLTGVSAVLADDQFRLDLLARWDAWQGNVPSAGYAKRGAEAADIFVADTVLKSSSVRHAIAKLYQRQCVTLPDPVGLVE